MTSPNTYAFVTIAFEGDRDLMLLQAQSMALHCPRELVHEIIVVDNFVGGAPAGWIDALMKAYGRLAQFVRIIRASDVATHPDKVAGWWHQQALKLAVSAHVQADRYVVLDAKNHLIMPLARDFLEDAEGRPRINRYGLANHPLRAKLENVCAYVGIADTEPLSKGLVRTSTPFIMVTQVARAVHTNVEFRDGMKLCAAMAHHEITEFFLYGAMLLHAGALHEIYSFDQPHCQAIWRWVAQKPGETRQVLERALFASGGPFFAVHRGAIPFLDPYSRQAVAEFWVDSGLFHNTDEALFFLLNAGEAPAA